MDDQSHNKVKEEKYFFIKTLELTIWGATQLHFVVFLKHASDLSNLTEALGKQD